MTRTLAFCFGIGLGLASAMGSCAAAAESLTNEVFLVEHKEPIVIRVLNGADGKPVVHLRLNLFAGYDEADIKRQLWHEEALTDEQGQAQLSNQLINLPYLQVWPEKLKTCQGDPREARFSMERIRRDGFSTPNRCGIAVVKDAPGVFTVYVRVKEKSHPHPAVLSDAASKSIPTANDPPHPSPAANVPPEEELRKDILRSSLELP